MSSQPNIAIIGGGPAGLALGLLLHLRRIPFTIFELRQKPTEDELAKPSGMLDLHADSGLEVIKECGLYDEFLPLTRECTEDFIVADKDGNILHALRGDRSKPEICRNNLTKLLVSNMPEEHIKWGHKLISATRKANCGHVGTDLDFGAHGKHTFDLVVGADGAWSEVRKLLTDEKPYYANMQCITVTIKDITKRSPHLADLVGSGSFSSFGNKHAIISQRGPMDSSRIYLWLTIPDEHFATTSGLGEKPASSIKEKLLEDVELLGTFGSLMKDLVVTACEADSADNLGADADIRALYSLPHGSAWENQPGITLVGDAAHLMLPNGEGVNLAMFDSLLLYRAVATAWESTGDGITSFQRTFEPAQREFEIALLQRAQAAGRKTDFLIGKMFDSDEAAHEFSNFLKGAA